MTSTTDSNTVDPAVRQAGPEGPADEQALGNEGGGRPWAVTAITAVVLLGSTICLFLPLIPEALGILACVMMLSLLFLRVPVAVAMIVPSLLGMYALRGLPLVESTLASLAYDHVASWTLSVVPMFILMGLLLWRAGLTESIYAAGRHWLGWLPGGLAVGTNVAGAGLAAASGSSTGTAYALARIGVPEMLKAGYDRRMAIGAVVVAGLPGQLIPPSILLVIYAGIAEVPIGPQLLAGVGPGLLVAAMFTVMIVVLARIRPELAGRANGSAAAGAASSWGDRGRSLLRVWPVPLLIAIIVVGMFSGVFTATEAGAAAALFAVLISFVWKRGDRPIGAVAQAAVGTVSSVGAIFLMLVAAGALSSMLTLTGISTGFADLIEGLGLGRIEFLLAMMVVYLVLGMFMEPMAIMVLTVPILMPTLTALDISLLWFGVFAVFLGELAVVTPPVGILAFIIHGITKDPEVNRGQEISLRDVFVAVGWFLPMAVLVAVVLILFPEIATFIPDIAAD
ncbi:tripartite ATP-independent transporter DctM subunit [Spinactinospora alkalitolerans]|uniref:Tripartite ATP-independent transporter DctM subunit n=1 Tax=Spinactinospora alkalitolerans TaxID=687207 RepID=A0A852TXY3_9ACTN|nr:TRAP transporter large permease subunit [Spinactinospora alkalitolerans]NYE48195.1 tripartite ATP-independent transporter DctM subunit [Spinactinospora alkalitolerans]